jgi:peptidoglycan/LPS O-acetylase OafA/YrhL
LGKTAGWGGGAALILAAFTLGRAKWPASRLASFVVKLGDASYALYLVHIIVMANITMYLSAIVKHFHVMDPSQHLWIYAAILVVASTVAALVTHAVFEKPFTTFLRRRFEYQPPSRVVAAPA